MRAFVALSGLVLIGAAPPQKPAASPDARLRAIIAPVSAARMKATVEKLVSFGTRHTLSSQTDPNRGIGAARDWIYGQFQQSAAQSGGRMTVEKQSFVAPPGPRNPDPVTVTNVVATLRVMAARRFDATIVFMAVAGEEQGLLGSTYFAEQAKQQGTDIEGMFTNDIVGAPNGDDPFSIRLFSEGVPTNETPEQAAIRQSIGGENDAPSRQLARYVKEVGDNSATHMTVRLIWRRDRYLRGGDHIPFLEQGYPAARFTESREDFAHQHQDVRVEDGKQYGDLPKFVDFRYVTRVARVNGAALANLALAPATPKDPKIDTSQLTNDTTLTWTANTEPDLKGYEIVWRESTDPFWTHAVPVGNVTSATLKLSKDNVQFGVRAVDRDGYRSPAAFPLPSD